VSVRTCVRVYIHIGKSSKNKVKGPRVESPVHACTFMYIYMCTYVYIYTYI